MYEVWTKDGKHGHITYPKGEVVTQKSGVVIQMIYVDEDNNYYIEVDGHLQEAMYNGFNGYVYRQDGE